MSIQSTIEFTVGSRVIFAAYDKHKNRVIARVITQNGIRITRKKNPALWNELRHDMISAIKST